MASTLPRQSPLGITCSSRRLTTKAALLEIARQADGTLGASRVYEHNRLRNYFASSVRYGDYIYGFDMMDLVCMAVRTGDIIWREKGLRSFRKGSLLIADGRLIVLSEADVTLAPAASDLIAPYPHSRLPQISAGLCRFWPMENYTYAMSRKSFAWTYETWEADDGLGVHSISAIAHIAPLWLPYWLRYQSDEPCPTSRTAWPASRSACPTSRTVSSTSRSKCPD